MHTLFPESTSKWEAIKNKLRSQIDPAAFAAWIDPIEAREINDLEIVLSLPNMVFYQGIMNEFWEKIEQSKTYLGFDSLTIRCEVEGINSFDEQTTPRTEFPGDPLPDISSKPRDLEQGEKESGNAFSISLSSNRMHLNSNYVFNSFVRGPSNQFALATCQNVAENPGRTYNPLFIYGSTGLGKTHLLHAVGNHILHNNRNAVVTYISSERFMNEMIYCIRHGKMWDFRQKYRHCDVFLVDDIQFISGKKSTQEEFFHTFNSLYEAKKQIIITSDLFPQDIPDIEDRLRNRFQWGLIADIQPPDVEHRMAILYAKADALNIKLSSDIAEYIATHAKKNIRELEGALHRVAAFSALRGRVLDKQLAMETLQNVMGDSPKRLTIDVVQKAVADHFKIKIADLKSPKRLRTLTLPRQVAMYLSRELTQASFPEIGERFGGKDHTTVMHAVRKIDSHKAMDLDLRAHIESLQRQLEQLS